jgi:hypothetical protein
MKKSYYYYFVEGSLKEEIIFRKQTSSKTGHESENSNRYPFEDAEDPDYQNTDDLEFENLVLLNMCNKFFRVDLRNERMSRIFLDKQPYMNIEFLKGVIDLLIHYSLDDDAFKEEVICLFPYLENKDSLIEDFRDFRSILYQKIAEEIQGISLPWEDPVRLYHEMLLIVGNTIYRQKLDEITNKAG